MYLKRNRRGAYEYWTLVQNERTARGPRQRVVAHLGKGPGLDDAERRGWEDLDALLEGGDGRRGNRSCGIPCRRGVNRGGRRST
jgi:hypothetical protein